MIYPVKILGKGGKVKKVLSTSTLTDLHWERFFEDENQIGLMQGPRSNSVPNHIKKNLDTKLAGLYDTSFSFIN